MTNYLDNPIYKQLGVKPVIHAAGTKTTHGGTRSHPAVFEAMKMASRSFVSIEELNRSVGKYIADITGAEAGMVTSGAASGMVLSIAACMTGTDIAKIRQLPDSTGMKNELIIQKHHVGNYTHMYTFTGAKLIEVGNVNDCLEAELVAAINENTAAIAYLLGPRIPPIGLSLKEVVSIARRYDIPVIVDAAAMLPPKANLFRYIDEGADLVTFSGGKIIHGPQGTGLLFGRHDLIENALANSNPHHAIGRPHKLAREQIVGLYTALKLYIDSNEEEFIATCRKKIFPVYSALKDIDDITISIKHDEINYHVPILAIQLKDSWQGPAPGSLPQLLLQGTPRIFIQYFKGLGDLVVNPISLQEGEPEVLGETLRNFFRAIRDRTYPLPTEVQ